MEEWMWDGWKVEWKNGCGMDGRLNGRMDVGWMEG